MIKNWLSWINISLLASSVFLVFFAFFIYLSRPGEIEIIQPKIEKASLPKGTFTREKQDLDAIGPPLISLPFSPMSLQLPDLRNYLLYHGRNERPDANPEQSLLHFSIAGSNESTTVYPNQPLYLVYDKTQVKSKYLFSKNNKETSLWIEAVPNGKEANVNVSMKNEAGKIIRKPEAHADFKLTEKAFSRIGLRNWFIDSFRVDGTLLARQKAKWYGPDLFIDKHGGDEYSDYIGKQRIDFDDGGAAYSVYVDERETLAWINKKWKKIIPGEKSRKYPLLVLRNIEDRLLKFDLWDVDGRIRTVLNLIKSRDVSGRISVEKAFKFVGARTRTQLMFEVKNERIIISPQDWLLFVNGEWKKITTPQEIDDYVNRKLIGPLFIIDGVERDDGRQILMGTVFNTSRSEQTSVEIPLQQGSAPTQKTSASPFSDRFRSLRERLVEDPNILPIEVDPRERMLELRNLSPEDRKLYIENLRRSRN